MAIEGTSDFARATIGTYRTGTTEVSAVLVVETNSLASGSAEDGEFFNLFNKKIVAGIKIDTAFSNSARAKLQIADYLALYPTAVAAAATDALKITGGTVYHNDAFTVLVPEDAGGYAGDVTATVMARNSMGSTPSANQIHWYLDPSGDAAKIANLKLAINGTTDTTKVKFGSSFTNTLGVKGLTASNGVASTESYASLTADNTGRNGNDIALTDTVGTVLVNESALASGKLAGGIDGGVHTLAILALNTDGATTTTVTVTASTTTTTTTDIVSPTFQVVTDNDTTATNLATCLNANSRLTAVAAGALVTVTQVTPGSAGNTTITVTDPLTTGITKTNFGASSALSGGGVLLELEGSVDDTNWAVIDTLDSDLTVQTTGVYRYLVDLSKTNIPYLRLHLNSGDHYIGTTGKAQFYFTERSTS